MYNHQHLLHLTDLLAQAASAQEREENGDGGLLYAASKCSLDLEINCNEEAVGPLVAMRKPLIQNSIEDFRHRFKSNAFIHAQDQEHVRQQILERRQQEERTIKDKRARVQSLKLTKAALEHAAPSLRFEKPASQHQPFTDDEHLDLNDTVAKSSKAHERREQQRAMDANRLRRWNDVASQRQKQAARQDDELHMLKNRVLAEQEETVMQRRSERVRDADRRLLSMKERESVYHFLTISNHVAKTQRMTQWREKASSQVTEKHAETLVQRSEDQMRKSEVKEVIEENKKRIGALAWLKRMQLETNSPRSSEHLQEVTHLRA